MKKIYLLASALTLTLISCESEEVSSVNDTIDASADSISEIETVQENDNTVIIDEEMEIGDFEDIQNQFFKEIDGFDLSELDNVDLDVVDLSNDVQSSNGALEKGRYHSRPRITSICLVKDADRCPFEDRQPASNMWWPEEEDDFFNPNAYYSSTKYHRMIFVTLSNGTALIRGITSMNDGDCKVFVNVWLKDKQNYDEFSSNGGEFKLEPGCASQAANPEELQYYEVNTKRSWLFAYGEDCIGQGGFGLEQRGENFRGQLGPNGAAFDSNIGANGYSNWGWITDKKTGERLWVMDFDFRLWCYTGNH